MITYTVPLFMVAFIVGLAAMPLDIYHQRTQPRHRANVAVVASRVDLRARGRVVAVAARPVCRLAAGPRLRGARACAPVSHRGRRARRARHRGASRDGRREEGARRVEHALRRPVQEPQRQDSCARGEGQRRRSAPPRDPREAEQGDRRRRGHERTVHEAAGRHRAPREARALRRRRPRQDRSRSQSVQPRAPRPGTRRAARRRRPPKSPSTSSRRTRRPSIATCGSARRG